MLSSIIDFVSIKEIYLLQIYYDQVTTKVDIKGIPAGSYFEQAVMDFETGILWFNDSLGQPVHKVQLVLTQNG